jgi:predicted phosphodiesterase
MMIAVLSDIHGNLPALQSITSELEGLDLEAVIAAGDYVGGPKSNEVISILRSFDSIMILGNMDLDLLRFAKGKAPEAWSTLKQYGLIRWTFEHIHSENLEYLYGLPETLAGNLGDAPSIRIVHVSPRDPYESIFPDRDREVLETAVNQTVADVLICGHIHVPWKTNLHGKLVMNPGAVSAPLNGIVGAQYALLHLMDGDWSVEHRSIGYDLSQIRKDYEESGLLEAGGAVSRAFLRSCETGKDYARAFLDFAYGLAKESGYDDIGYFPDDIWELAVESFPWDQPA